MARLTGGRKTVTTAGTAVQLNASVAAKWIDITALSTNTGTIVVGGSTVVAAAATRKGVALNPGDTWSRDIDDVSDLWIDSTVNGEGVSFLYGAKQ